MKKRTRSIVAWIGAILVAAVLAGCSAAFVATSNAVVHPGSLYVPTGTDYNMLVDSLRAGRKIRFIAPFKAYSRHIGLTEGVAPGHYALEKGMNIVTIARNLKFGRQTPVRVVVRPSRLPADLAKGLSRRFEADSASFRAAMRDSMLLAEWGFADELELFSIFIPNTYEAWWTESPTAFTRRMKREYDRFWNDTRTAKLLRTGLSRLEVITLASILVEETRQTDEMPTMAGVYINRLRAGMRLQADPTVKYAVGDFALRRIRSTHTATPSPYNTYVNKGLPPTPITMPSIAAIDAVLDYKEHKYLYFCAREDFSGYHNFAATYPEHLQNARRWAAELDRRGVQ